VISVIIPTYKSPESLDLCIKSAVLGQKYKNQIIVVVDGFYDLNKHVLEKYADSIEILNLEQNVGLCKGMNLGVYNSSFKNILLVNDDNVFPKNWDVILNEDYRPNTVLTPNHIEPIPSMFKQFVITNLGRDPKTFDLENLWEYVNSINKNVIEETGSTPPIFMSKLDYLKLGGWDENYELGVVADWEFFLKCQLAGLKMLRTYRTHFYHFVSLTTNINSESNLKRQTTEMIGHEYSKYKWGSYIKHNSETNLKTLH